MLLPLIGVSAMLLQDLDAPANRISLPAEAILHISEDKQGFSPFG